MDILFIDADILGAHFWFMALNWTIIGWYRTMFICQPNIMRTSMLKFVTTFVQSNICSSTFIKGHDRATIEISRQSDNAIERNVVKADEIKKYLDPRYVSASEATWHIFKFDMHERFPIVEHLQYHLPNQQMVLFDDDGDVQEVAAQSAISRMMLTE